ncbi:hypothetical protein E2562_020813 [Oryza meyeriana var. granulata]|uniref:Uncharacterized protein n=1 Tax=Oryza meyeriana var. granulata TaxID=110450 RepID=A0A6G1CIP5_9ORYZ|nr:hypothetical protein E2562_020813 [Oryza meyeriana var. granulata]
MAAEETGQRGEARGRGVDGDAGSPRRVARRGIVEGVGRWRGSRRRGPRWQAGDGAPSVAERSRVDRAGGEQPTVTWDMARRPLKG